VATNFEDRIRAKIVVPLVVLVVVATVLLLFGVYSIEKQHFSDEVHSKTLEVEKLFQGLLYKESKFMLAQLNFLDDEPGLLEAWSDRDRSLLYERARPFFEEMFVGFNVTHFYFIEPDGTCFLRVHSPEKFGDRINRFTFKKAVADSETSYGIELGTLGTFTLRVVQPWFHNGTLLGYLELGEEIEHLTPRIRQITGLDLIYTIDKSFLDKENWQSGMEGVLGPKGDWDRFDKFVIIDKSLNKLSPMLEKFIAKNFFQTVFEILPVDGVYLGVCVHPLRDVSGRQVGSTVVIADITAATLATRQTVLWLGGIILLVSFLFMAFYYIYSGRIEKQVFKYHNHLEDLVRDRTKELQIALDEVKVLSGFLPICASCKQIRDDKGYWTQIESYIRDHSEAEFSHGICPDCAKKLYPGFNMKED